MYADNGLGYALGPNGYADAGYGSAGYGVEGGGLISIANPADGFVDINLFAPGSQSFPASVAEVVAAGFSSNVLAGYACQDVGTTLADYSGNAHTLTKIVGATTGTIFGQRAVGLDNGLTFTSQKAFETSMWEVSGAEAALGTELDFDWTVPWSVLVMFRINDVQTTAGALYSKGTYPLSWGCYCPPASGQLSALVNDGAGHQSVATAAVNHADGAWHWAYIRYNPVTDFVSIDTDLSLGNTTSTAAIVSTATPTMKFRIGEWIGAATGLPGQTRGLIVFGDCNTTVAAIQNWWRHTRTPPALTFDRASSFACKIADDATGDVVGTYTTGAMALEYQSACTTNTRKLGYASYEAVTNLIPNTDLNIGANWAPAGTYLTYGADSPRGFREAPKHTKTAAGDKVLAAAANGAAVTAALTYTASVYCQWDGVGTAPELRVYRADGTTLIGTTSATSNDNTRRRLTLTFVAPATEAVRLAFSGAAAASAAGGAWFSLPMINLGANAYPWIYTKGATAATVGPTLYASVPGINGDKLTAVSWFAVGWQTDPNQRGIVTLSPTAATLVNARSMHMIAGGGQPLAASYDGAGAPIVVPVVPATITVGLESKLVGRFDRSKRNGYSARIDLVGVAAGNDATAAPVGVALPRVYIGTIIGGSRTNGAISKVRIYRRIEAVAA
jgi:hypothetical protein